MTRMEHSQRLRIPRLMRVLLFVAALAGGWWAAGGLPSGARTNDAPRNSPAAELMHSVTTQPAAVQTLPAARGGQDLIGRPMPELHFSRWMNTPGNRPVSSSGKVTLYRWWTDTCPYCQTTLPAVEMLRQKYEAKGLQVIAVYHPKPVHAVDDQTILDAAKERHYTGAIAVDADWSQLKELYLHNHRGATSVSFLVDATGIIRFVHPGVAYFPSTDAKSSQENADYQLIDQAIESLLGEPTK